MSMMLRRQMMRKAAADDYITDGLVLFLDGLNRGGVSGEWHDLVADNVCTFTGSYTELTNGVSLPGSNASYGQFSSLVQVADSTGTLEAAVELTAWESTGRPILAMGNVTNIIGGSVASGASGGTTIFRYSMQSGTMPCWNFTGSERNLKMLVGGNASVAVLNGANGTSSTVSSWSPSTNVGLLGYRGSGNAFKGTFYAVRVYNRQLTAAEIIHNQRIDNARFNLGLTI